MRTEALPWVSTPVELMGPIVEPLAVPVAREGFKPNEASVLHRHIVLGKRGRPLSIEDHWDRRPLPRLLGVGVDLVVKRIGMRAGERTVIEEYAIVRADADVAAVRQDLVDMSCDIGEAVTACDLSSCVGVRIQCRHVVHHCKTSVERPVSSSRQQNEYSTV